MGLWASGSNELKANSAQNELNWGTAELGNDECNQQEEIET